MNSSQSQSAGFFVSLYEIIRRHPVLFSIFFVVPFTVLMVSLGLKCYYLFYDTTHYVSSYKVDEKSGYWSDANAYFGTGTDRYIRELDIAGLLGGIVGIFIGLFIAVLSDMKSEEDKRRLQRAIDEIRDQTRAVQEAVGLIQPIVGGISDIVGGINARVVATQRYIDHPTEILASIDKVINMARQEGNNLFILSPLFPISMLQPYRSVVVSKFAGIKPHELDNMFQSAYGKQAAEFQQAYLNVENLLKDLAQEGEDGTGIELKTLIEQQEPSELRQYVAQLVNHFDAIDTYSPTSRSLLRLSKESPPHKRLLIPYPFLKTADLKGIVTDELMGKHQQTVREMEDLGIRVLKMTKPNPLQLFISIPKQNGAGVGRCMGLCIEESELVGAGPIAKFNAYFTEDPHGVARMIERYNDACQSEVNPAY